MKKLLLATLVAAFACVSAVQAGEAKSTCAAETAKSSCCATKTAKKADVSVRGATLLVRR